MIEVTQTRTGKPRGNCTEASIASLLEVDLSAVPELLDPGHPDDAHIDVHRPQWRWYRLLEWIKTEHKRQLLAVQFTDYRPSIEVAWNEAAPRLKEELGRFAVKPRADWWIHHLACGHNPDGIQHMTVAKLGTMVFDPNPRRRGIVDCDQIAWLVPLELVPDEYRSMPGTQWGLK